MSLQPAWIDRVHGRLLVRYGAAWIRMWDGVEPTAVKADWVQVLDGLAPWAIAYGLDNLPSDRPPTALQFRDICRRAPARPALRLVAPLAKRESVDAQMAKLQVLRRRSLDPLASARELRRREADGDRTLTMAQRDFWRRALQRELAQEQEQAQ